MKKYLYSCILLLLSIFLLYSPANVNSGVIIQVLGGGSGCPAWGTYGTAVGNILFAWDGEHPSGNTYACLSDESAINGVNTGGAFGADGGVIWVHDADDDRLVWSIDSGDIDHDNADGLTIWIEFKTAALTADNFVFDFVGDVNDYWRMKLLLASTAAASNWMGNGTYDGSAVAGITADGSTYNSIGISIKVGEAGNDHASNNGGGWSEQDDDLVAWNDPEVNIMLGDLLASGSTDVLSIRKFVVLKGFEQAKPW